jgi:hypothetical protein
MVIPVHAVLYDDPDPDVAARADQPACRLWLDRGSWRALTRAQMCTTIVHEWGHLLGLGHSEGPLSVMAGFPARRPRRCAALEPRRRVASAGYARRAPGALRGRAAAGESAGGPPRLGARNEGRAPGV